MQLSQPTLEPHSLCYTCWVQVVYSLLTLLYFFLSDTLLLLSSYRREGVRSALPGLRGLLGVRLPVDVLVAPCTASESSFIVFVLRFRCIRHFVINVINNISISIYYDLFVICAVIYYSFCCIYVWLDPGTYMIARFMSFYKPGVTVFGALRPCLSPYRDERQMNRSYMVLLDMWNMFGQKFLSFIGG